MINKLIRSHFPEWIEAGMIIGVTLFSAIFAAGITYYKVDVMTEDVAYIKMKLEVLPPLVTRMEHLEENGKHMQNQLDYLFRRNYDGKEGREESVSYSTEQAAKSF